MTKPSYRITLTGPRGSVLIAPDAPLRLVEGGLEGFDCPEPDVKIRAWATQPGGYAEKRRFAERELALTFAVGPEDADGARRRIGSLMNPEETLTIDAEIGDIRRRIDVIPAEKPLFVRPTFHHPMEVTLRFVAPTVFFYEPEARHTAFRDGVGMLAFPFTSMAGAGTVTGLWRVKGAATVENPGDAPCGVIVRVRAEGGDVVAPRVSVGTQRIRCPVTLSAGEELVISTMPRAKTIEIDGVRSLRFDRDSVFFALPAGESVVSTAADAGEEYMAAEISFTPLYYGI